MKRDGLTILVNDKPRAILHTRGYYPLILDPGSVTLGYSARISEYPIYETKADSLQLSLKAGQTYYVAYRPWNGSWKPKLMLIDPTDAQREIKDDTLSRGAE